MTSGLCEYLRIFLSIFALRVAVRCPRLGQLPNNWTAPRKYTLCLVETTLASCIKGEPTDPTAVWIHQTQYGYIRQTQSAQRDVYYYDLRHLSQVNTCTCRSDL